MRRSGWFALVALLCAVGQFASGCMGCTPDPTPEEDAGVIEEDAGEEDAGEVDAGIDLTCTTDAECADKPGLGPDYVCDAVSGADTEGTCVPRCRLDDDCERYDLGLRCDDLSGQCIPARGCMNDTNCPPQNGDPDDYCGVKSPGCRCVTESNLTGFDGVCRRRRGVCDECTDDTQCGSGPTFDPSGRCLALQGDPNGGLEDGGTRKYCFYAESACGCGMVRDPSTGVCTPQSKSCGQVGCSEDNDCPFGSVCNAAQCLCEPRCIWSFDRQELNPPGCPPGKSCWVDPENLDPTSVNFGAGRCRAPCEDGAAGEAQCDAIDARLTCKGEKVPGGESPKRCRPEGECMDDLECPAQPMESVYLGYCDRSTFECKTDCRTGTDPTSGEDYEDCISGYKCVNENGMNVCKQQTCTELGGARLGCFSGQYCCGEDRNFDGTADACPATGLEVNNCFVAPAPPFCTVCMNSQECQQYVDSSPVPTSGSPLPSLCMNIGPPPGGGDPVAICAPSTHNDFTLDSFGVAKAFRGCPAKYGATPIRVPCTSSADCGPNGLCDESPEETLPDGGHPLRCLCTADGTANKTSDCPGDPDAGTQTVCRFGPSGKVTTCIQSVVCMPSPGAPFADPSTGGCGL